MHPWHEHCYNKNPYQQHLHPSACHRFSDEYEEIYVYYDRLLTESICLLCVEWRNHVAYIPEEGERDEDVTHYLQILSLTAAHFEEVE